MIKNKEIFMRYPEGRAKALTLSYDDGTEQDIRLIELLDKYGIKATFNLNSGVYAPEGQTFPEGQIHRRLSYSQVSEVYGKNGHEVATHSYTHPFLERLSSAAVCYEIIKDREALEAQFGTIVRGHAYPYGTYNDTVVDCLRACGIVYARTVKPTHTFEIPTDWLRLDPTCHHDDKEALSLAKTFVETERRRQPALFYLWGHSFEFEGKNNWEHMTELCEILAGHDDVWYASNIDVYNYVEAYNSLVFSADMSTVYNPTATRLYFIMANKNYTIAPNETLKFG